jgi:hypothetical protein
MKGSKSRKGLGVEIPFFLIVIPVVVFLGIFVAWTMGLSKSISTIQSVVMERNTTNRLYWLNMQPVVDGRQSAMEMDEMMGIYALEVNPFCIATGSCGKLYVDYDGIDGTVDLQKLLELMFYTGGDCNPIGWVMGTSNPPNTMLYDGNPFLVGQLKIPPDLSANCIGKKYLYNETIFIPTPDNQDKPTTIWTLLHYLVVKEDLNINLAEFTGS